MKAIFCSSCGEIHGLRSGHVEECGCGLSLGRWLDPQRGIAQFAERAPGAVFVLGIHNGFLMTGDTSVWKDADGYLFKTQESPVVRIRPGHSNDTSLISVEEMLDVG